MAAELLRIAEQCDGVRCDMAMLLLPEVFERTWGIPAAPFWPWAIQRLRDQFPGFVLLAEVYWNLEWTLQQQGFDYTYDKRLYDRLRDQHAEPIRDHLIADLSFQNKLARFLENHDEPRAAATFPWDVHQAAAIITYLSPGLRFFHQGQLEGRRKHISPHLVRGPEEPVNESVKQFYGQLLDLLRNPALRQGSWRLLQAKPAWDGNWTWNDFIAFAWRGPEQQCWVVTINFAPHRGQCYLALPFSELAGERVRLEDRLGTALYERNGDELMASGLYLDMPAWGYHVFELR